MHARSRLERAWSSVVFSTTLDADNIQHPCYLSLSAPSLEHSASRGLPSVGSGEPASTVPSLDLGIPSQSMGVCLVVLVAGVVDNLVKRDVVKTPLHRTRSYAWVLWKLLGQGPPSPPGLLLEIPPGMFPCIPGGILLGTPPGTFPVGGLHLYLAEPSIWPSVQRCILQEGCGLEGVLVWMWDSRLPVHKVGIET